MLGCYVYVVGMRMRDVDVDVIGEELQDGDARTRQLCAGVGDKMMPKFRQRNENAVEVQDDAKIEARAVLTQGRLVQSTPQPKHGMRPSSWLAANS
jgi:hypothetical protein